MKFIYKSNIYNKLLYNRWLIIITLNYNSEVVKFPLRSDRDCNINDDDKITYFNSPLNLCFTQSKRFNVNADSQINNEINVSLYNLN